MAAKQKTFRFRLLEIIHSRAAQDQPFRVFVRMKDWDDDREVSFDFISPERVVDVGTLSIRVELPEET